MLAEADEELRARRVGIVAARHRQDARHVRRVVELRLDIIAAAAVAGPLRAAALDHEAVDDAMEDQIVVEADLAPGPGSS